MIPGIAWFDESVLRTGGGHPWPPCPRSLAPRHSAIGFSENPLFFERFCLDRVELSPLWANLRALGTFCFGELVEVVERARR